jgi:hypothetical protein
LRAIVRVLLRPFLDSGGRLSVARIELTLGIIYGATTIFLAAWSTFPSQPPITIAADRPTTISADRPVTITAERPFTVSSPKQITIFAEQPVSVSVDRPVEVLTERPIAVSAAQPVVVAAGRPVTVSAERPVNLVGESPITVSSERPFTISAQRPVHITVERPPAEPGPTEFAVRVPAERPVIISAERPAPISGVYAVSIPAFLIATSVLLTGAFALLLEARLISTPAKVDRWLEMTGRRRVREKASRRQMVLWPLAGNRAMPDLAVVQLVFGSVFVPLLTLTPQFVDFGWRLLTIAVASEVAYLAFLGAQATKVTELTDLVDEIERAKKELAGEVQEVSRNGALSKTELLKQVVNDFEDRADALCRQLGFLFDASAGSPKNESGQPATSYTRTYLNSSEEADSGSPC